MQPDQLQRPVSPELKQLQEPAQNSIRKALRIAGLILVLAGFVCIIVGMSSFFESFGSFESPHYFWLSFVGMPLIFAGSVLCMFGFMGAVARFAAGEAAPVGADTAKYMAEETKGAVETVAKAAAKGVAEGLQAGQTGAGQRKD